MGEGITKIRYRVLSLQDKHGCLVTDFRRARIVMLYHLGRQHSLPAPAKSFRHPVKVDDIVEANSGL